MTLFLPTPIEAFLDPLSRLAVRHDCEAYAIWVDGSGWQAQDDDTDLLDPDEIAFHAEGMLLEGFGLHWHMIARSGTPVVIRLFYWQGMAPDMPVPDAGLDVMASGCWPPAALVGASAPP